MTHASLLLDLPETASAARLPPPPAWLSDIPVPGQPIADKWKGLAESSTEDVVRLACPYVRSVTEWFLQAAGSVGQVVLLLFLTIGIAAILYAKGEVAAAWCGCFGRRLADKRGEDVVVLAWQAIRSVALGVVVTALTQSLVTAIALVAAGVPQAGLLTALPCSRRATPCRASWRPYRLRGARPVFFESRDPRCYLYLTAALDC